MSGTATLETPAAPPSPAVSSSAPTPSPTPAVEGSSDDLTPDEQAWLAAYEANTPLPTSETVVSTRKEDGSEAVVAVAQPPAPAPSPAEGEVVEEVPGPDGKKRQMVPHGALHAERETHKATKAKLQSAEEKLALALEVLARHNSLPAPQPPAKGEDGKPVDPWDEPDVDKEKDPLGAIDQMHRRLKVARQSQLEAQSAQLTEARLQTVESQYKLSAVNFAMKEPSFSDAYNHWIGQQEARYEALGLTNPEMRAKQIAIDELNIVKGALQRKADPAGVIFALAKAGGYVYKAPEPKPNGAAKPNGGANPAAQQIRDLDAAKQANATLSSMGGGAPRPKHPGEMSEAEFDAYVTKLEKEGKEDELQRFLSGAHR